MATARKKRPPQPTSSKRTRRRPSDFADRPEPVPVVVTTGSASAALRLRAGAVESMRLYQEWLRIMLGSSDRAIPDRDQRFADATWRDNPFYRRLAQSYLAFADAIDAVASTHPDWRTRERDKFLAGILTSALSPTNTLLGNPS